MPSRDVGQPDQEGKEKNLAMGPLGAATSAGPSTPLLGPWGIGDQLLVPIGQVGAT